MDSPGSADSGYRALRVMLELDGRRQPYLFGLATQMKRKDMLRVMQAISLSETDEDTKDHRPGSFAGAGARATPQLRRGHLPLALRRGPIQYSPSDPMGRDCSPRLMPSRASTGT